MELTQQQYAQTAGLLPPGTYLVCLQYRDEKGEGRRKACSAPFRLPDDPVTVGKERPTHHSRVPCSTRSWRTHREWAVEARTGRELIGIVGGTRATEHEIADAPLILADLGLRGGGQTAAPEQDPDEQPGHPGRSALVILWWRVHDNSPSSPNND